MNSGSLFGQSSLSNYAPGNSDFLPSSSSSQGSLLDNDHQTSATEENSSHEDGDRPLFDPVAPMAPSGDVSWDRIRQVSLS